jgi:hypothetical protein
MSVLVQRQRQRCQRTRLWIATVIVSILVAPLGAQVNRVPAKPGARTSAVPLQLENQWTAALVARDARTFERLLAPGFVYTENAAVMSRSDVIGSVNGPDTVQWARNEGMKMRDFGDVQIVTGVLHLRGRGKSGAFDRRYQFTDTWQRRNAGWQIIAAQDYLIPRVK